MQSCTSGRNAFFTGMYPLRTGMIPPQLPGSPSYLRPGTPALAKFLLDLGYNTGEFGKNHLGDHTAALPTAHGFQEYWGYLYHLDAMQQVSFPDINKNPTTQTVAPPCKNMPIPGVPEVPGAVDPKTTICLTPPRNVLACKSSDGTEKNQTCHDEGPLTLDRSRTVDEEISAKVIDFPTATILGAPTSRSSSGTTQRACTSRQCCRRSMRRCWARPEARTGASRKPA
jgi:arylsulfatase